MQTKSDSTHTPSSVKLLSTQDSIAFAVSLVCHLTLCLTLAIVLIANRSVGKEELTLSLENDASTVELMLEQISTEPTVPDPQTSETLQPADSSALLHDLVRQTESRMLLVSNAIRIVSESSDEQTTNGQFSSSSLKEVKQDAKAKSRATFFGAEAYGNRFVFVIDSSGSMRGFRWESLCTELLRALRSLSPDQEFFVVSFDTSAHPMLGLQPPKDLFLKPTSRNVKKVQSWLRSIVHGHETHPASAMGIALQLKPDAIFLLSDGEIRDNTANQLREWNKPLDTDDYRKVAIPVHTVLLHSELGYATLEQIAVENQGTFTPVIRRP